MEQLHPEESGNRDNSKFNKFGRWITRKFNPEVAPIHAQEVFCEECNEFMVIPGYDLYLKEREDKSYDMYFECSKVRDAGGRPTLASVHISEPSGEEHLQSGARKVPNSAQELANIDPVAWQIEIAQNLPDDYDAPIIGGMYDRIWNIKP